MSDPRARLKELCRPCVKIGRVVLTSGKVSDFYFNGKMVILHPEGADLTARFMYDMARAMGATAVAGLSVGADPLVSTVGHVAFLEGNPLKMAYVRKQPKEHGAKSQIDGPPFDASDKVVILEDVVTTGGSAMKAVERLKEAYGCEIIGVVALVDRNEGGRETFENAGLELKSIFTKSDFQEKP